MSPRSLSSRALGALTTRSRRGVRVAMALLGAATLALGLAAPAGAVTGVITVAATGSFDSLPAGATVAGVVSPSGAQQFDYSFTATCDAAACPASGDTYTWSFGDGTSATSSTTPNASHAYAATGVYTATLTVTSSTGAGQSSVTVLVSPRFADADASTNTAGDAAPADRAAIWTVAAYQIMGGCTGATGARGLGTQSRSSFCPTPTVNAAAPTLDAPSVTNGATGQSCLSTATGVSSSFLIPPYENCGLDPAAFLLADSAAGNPAGDPLNGCGVACQAALLAGGYMTSGGSLVLPTNDCGAGWTVSLRGDYATPVAGVPDGCVSRGQFFQYLVTALEGGGSSAQIASELATQGTVSAATACPGDASTLTGSPYAAFVERASALGLTTTWMGTTDCNLSAPITKGEAYQILAQATGTPAATTCSGYRDLTDETLGHGTATPDPNCLSDLALVAAGVPVVDSTTCVDGGGGSCFNAYDPLSRGGLATLLASLVVGLPTPSVATYTPTSWTAPTDAVAAYDGAVIQSGPNGYYELNDLTSAAFDASGHNAYGAYVGSTTHASTGPVVGTEAGSVTLGGSGYVAVPAPYSGSGSTTTSLWFDTTSANGVLLAGQSGAVGTTPQSSTAWLYLRNGRLYAGRTDLATAQSVADGNWHMVTLVTTSSAVSLYLDGQLVGSSKAGDTPVAMADNQVGVGYEGGAWTYFSGSIADVATWASALSTTTIDGLWTASGAPAAWSTPWDVYANTVFASGPAAFWRLNGANGTGCSAAAGSTICDQSSTGATLAVASGSYGGCGAVAGAATGVASQTGAGPTNDTTSQEIDGNLGPCVASGSAALASGSVNAATLEAWVKPETSPSSGGSSPQYVVETGSSAGQLILSVNSACESYQAGGASFEIAGPSGEACVSVAGALTPGSWTHLVAVWSDPSDLPATSSQMTLYVNGVAATTTSLPAGTAPSGPLALSSESVGGDPSSSATDLFGASGQRGAVADVAVYSQALSATQVKTHYCAATTNVATTSC